MWNEAGSGIWGVSGGLTDQHKGQEQRGLLVCGLGPTSTRIRGVLDKCLRESCQFDCDWLGFFSAYFFLRENKKMKFCTNVGLGAAVLMLKFEFFKSRWLVMWPPFFSLIGWRFPLLRKVKFFGVWVVLINEVKLVLICKGLLWFVILKDVAVSVLLKFLSIFYVVYFKHPRWLISAKAGVLI